MQERSEVRFDAMLQQHLGIGFAAILGRCLRISDAMIVQSAFALADYTARHCQSGNQIFPPVSELRAVSVEAASRGLAVALRDGSATPGDLVAEGRSALLGLVKSRTWQPGYIRYRFVGHNA
jgi:malate dehydrogenase (oxaloacetate-decarboxylating)